jgi:uncharacterized protein
MGRAGRPGRKGGGMRRICAVVFCLSVAFPAAAADKSAKIRRMLEVSGVRTAVIGISSSMRQPTPRSVVGNDPAITEAMLAAVAEEIRVTTQSYPDEIMEAAVSIYDRSFTEAEIEELTRFYQTPIGQKAVAQGPRLLQETLAGAVVLGAKLASDLRDRSRRRLAEMGYVPRSAPPPARAGLSPVPPSSPPPPAGEWSVSPGLIPNLPSAANP